MEHRNYRNDFEAAFERSRKWKQIPRDAEFPTDGVAPTALETLPIVERLVDSFPHQEQQIRTNCTGVHRDIHRLLLSHAPCFLTIGDVIVDGKHEYGTSVQYLKREINGSRRGSSEEFKAHVWLTFPDMEIIDATFFIYKYHDDLPEPWTWSQHIICSSDASSDKLPLRYFPMLISNKIIHDIVRDMIPPT